VVYAVTDEMALHLDDVVFRRTGLGTVGNPGDGALKKCADIMGGLLGWDSATKKREISWVKEHYIPIKKEGEIPKSRDDL
jgi:glycerol-3-phosphate dehydrogenase